MDILEAFPIFLYALGSVLLVVLIILGVKLIGTVEKINTILDDSYNKMKSLDGFFNVIDTITDTLSSVNDKLVGTVSSIVGRLFYKNKKKSKKKENDLDE